MSAKNAKMLRRLKRDNKKDKRLFNSLTDYQKCDIARDYKERGKQAKENYKNLKKDKKREQISNSKTA